MLSQAVLVTFREGLESLLIVGVIIAYLRKTGRDGLVRGVHIGLGISVITCSLAAWGWWRWMQSAEGGPNQAVIEGISAVVAAVLVGLLLWQTVRMGRRLKGEIEARVARVAGGNQAAPSRKAIAGVALLTAVLVTREGFEAILFLGVQAFSVSSTSLVLASAAGLALAGGLAWLWSRYSSGLHIGAVLRVTAVFLLVFLIQLVVYSMHEFSESGLIAGSEAFHDATERFGPEGDIGHVLAYSLVAAPLLYLVLARRKRPGGNAVSGERPADASRSKASPSAAPGRRVAG